MIHIVGLCALYVLGYGIWWTSSIYPRHAGVVLMIAGIGLMFVYFSMWKLA